jgi:hypothetical protein
MEEFADRLPETFRIHRPVGMPNQTAESDWQSTADAISATCIGKASQRSAEVFLT